MNNLNQRLYGILIDVSGSMQQSYEKIEQERTQQFQQNKIDKTRLQSVWNLILKVIQEEKLKNDYVFASAFGCKNKVDVVDLIEILSYLIWLKQFKEKFKGQLQIFQDLEQNQNNDYYKLLYSLVEQRGAINLKTYYTLERLRQDVPQFKVQLLYFGFSKNEALLNKFIQKLPQQVKRIPTDNQDRDFQQFNQTLKKFINVATFGLADYDLINKEIVDQIRNLDNHIDYDCFLRKIIDQLDQLIFQLSETGDDEDIRNLKKIKKRFETISLPNVPNSKKYLEFVNILQPNISDQIIDVSDQKNLNQFSIKSIKEFGSFLKKELNIINYEEEEQLFQQIKKLSYGETPIRKCLRITSNHDYKMFNDKFLFIISDGYSTDGDPTQYESNQKIKDF